MSEPINVDQGEGNADWVKQARVLSTEEAIYRIREGLHAEFPTHADGTVDQVLVEALERGVVEALLLPDNKLAFRGLPESTIGETE